MKSIILLFLLGITGCAAAIQAKPAMSRGEGLYRSHCSLCHSLQSPEKHTFEKLERYVIKYGRGLTADQRQELLLYLKAASSEQK